MLEDKRLVLKLKHRHEEALKQIYEKYKGESLSLAAALTRDRDSAEDILHDVIVSFALPLCSSSRNKAHRQSCSFAKNLVT